MFNKVCLKENLKKYTQTQGTICTCEPLLSLLGRFGETAFCDEILNGSAVFPPRTPNFVKDFFQQLKRDNITEEVPIRISTEDFQEGWGKMKEASSTGKSGIHFGNLITCLEDQRLAQFESSIAQVPFLTGYSPSLWREGTIVMIKKKAGDADVSALRSIVLLEADYNFNNKILGKRAMQRAESSQLLALEQYRSRKKKMVIDQALHKKLTYDIICQH